MKGYMIVCIIFAMIVYLITRDWIITAIGSCAYIASALILLERKLYYEDKEEQENIEQE